MFDPWPNGEYDFFGGDDVLDDVEDFLEDLGIDVELDGD